MEVWGKWERDVCNDILAKFPYNPLIKLDKEKVEFLAGKFKGLVEGIDPITEERFHNNEQTVEFKVDISKGVVTLSPIGEYRGNVGCITIGLMDFRAYLKNIWVSKTNALIEGQYIIKDHYWQFDKLV
jgi:hypothetical protein